MNPLHSNRMNSNSTTRKVPYRHLSAFYGLYFGLLGCIAPFWGLYLQAHDFAASDIGMLLAVFSIVRIIAPSIWVGVGNKIPSFMASIHWACALMILCFSAVLWASEVWHFVLIMIAYGFFWSALLPQYETLTLNTLKENIDDYGRIRLWGSIGFIAVVTLLGSLFDFIDIIWLAPVMLFIMCLLLLNGLKIKAPKRWKHSEQVLSEKLKLSWPMAAFFIMTMLLQLSHGPYYTFFSIHLQALDYSNTAIGLLWSLGVLAEVFIFWKFSVLTRRWSIFQLTVLSLLITGLRWLLIGFYSDIFVMLILCQLLHAFTFGVLHATGVKYVAYFFPGKHHAQGQALFSGLGFGLGGALGAWFSGIYWLELGANMVFATAGCIGLMAAIIGYFGLRKISIN